jgi:hypothetical protein
LNLGSPGQGGCRVIGLGNGRSLGGAGEPMGGAGTTRRRSSSTSLEGAAAGVRWQWGRSTPQSQRYPACRPVMLPPSS